MVKNTKQNKGYKYIHKFGRLTNDIFLALNSRALLKACWLWWLTVLNGGVPIIVTHDLFKYIFDNDYLLFIVDLLQFVFPV